MLITRRLICDLSIVSHRAQTTLCRRCHLDSRSWATSGSLGFSIVLQTAIRHGILTSISKYQHVSGT